MSIYTAADSQFGLSIAHEDFATYYQNARVVSMESISQYLHRIKDTFHSAKNFITSDQDKFVQETLNNKHETLYLVKTVPYNEFRLETVSRPEMFSSLYVDYLQDLQDTGKQVHEVTLRCLDNLKLAVATFINEHQDGQLDTIYGARYFEQDKKILQSAKDLHKKHFKAPQNKTKTTVQSVIRSMTDFDKIYPLIDNCASTLNSLNASHIDKQVKDVTELINTLVDHNLKTGILVNSQDAKKELVAAIDQTARSVEFFAALCAEFLGVCAGFKSLTEALAQQG